MTKVKLRCAIYTRKSVEEGLNVDFNTLEAQREFCESYVKTQAFNGWEVIPKHYDDGGYSGKNMKRPAMQDLIADIDAGKVDVVVVYKVDRLSRSLIDFSNFLAYIEERKVSLVLVTQNIDTTTTMGRMLVNLLMTFAQYEREMSSDRVRDKMCAMRKRGMWTGGKVPHGYTSQDRRLEINEAAARDINVIFDKYIEMGSPRSVVKEMNKLYREQGKRSIWSAKRINDIIRNHIYIGEVRVGDEYVKGEHEPIITREKWDVVQRLINWRPNSMSRATELAGEHLLRNLIFCGNCNGKMKCTYSKKAKKRNYYVCYTKNEDSIFHDRCKTHTLPADLFDEVIKGILEKVLQRVEIQETLKRLLSEQQWETLCRCLENKNGLFREMLPIEQYSFVNFLVKKVVIYDDRFELHLKKEALTGFPTEEVEIITRPLKVCRIGMRWGLYCSNDPVDFSLDKGSIKIISAIKDAYKYRDDLIHGRAWSTTSLAALHKKDTKWMKERIRLAFVSPRIIVALLNHEPIQTSIAHLVKIASLPWREQESAVGM